MHKVGKDLVDLVSVSGGWTTVKFRDGTTKKVRNTEVKEMEANAPIPAHFVRDRAPGKVAKIGDTQFKLDNYFVSDMKTPSGRRTIDCGDEVGAALRGMEIDQVYEMAAQALEVTVDSLRSKYGHLNIGMQRMNLGNRIRGAEQSKAKTAEQLAKAKKREELAALRAEERARIDAERAEAKRMKEAEKAAKAAVKKAAQEEVAIA